MKRFKIWNQITEEFLTKSITVEEILAGNKDTPEGFSVEEIKSTYKFLSYINIFNSEGDEFCEGDIVARWGLDEESEYYKKWLAGDDDSFEKIPNTWVDVVSPKDRFWLKNESFGYEGEDLCNPHFYHVLGNIYEDKVLVEKYNLEVGDL